MRFEVEVDAATAQWLRQLCSQRGGSPSAAAAAQLRADALADSVAQHAAVLPPDYFEDMTAEREAAEAA